MFETLSGCDSISSKFNATIFLFFIQFGESIYKTPRLKFTL